MSRIKRIPQKVMLVILCAALAVGGIGIYGKYKISKIPELTFWEALAYTTKDNGDAVISVGMIKDGEASWQVYGENGKELLPELHIYEIGSVTKTFTAALIEQAISEGKIKLDDTIQQYLPLTHGNEYPTIKELLTHTSGYKGCYFEKPMISNFFMGRNDFCGITKEMVLNKAMNLSMDKETDTLLGASGAPSPEGHYDAGCPEGYTLSCTQSVQSSEGHYDAGCPEGYDFTYSNYGYAVLGLVLESIYDTDYSTLVNGFIENELGLTDTGISDQRGDLCNYWDWEANDAYLPAGAITSNIADMLSYAQMQLDGNPYFSECHKSLKTINASTKAYKTMGIHMDEIGMSWVIDNENEIIWHNGGTGNYNSYIGFRPKMKTAVVVLSNLAPNDRIPATVLGVKLLLELENQSEG